jgi:hypothetical protein
MRIYFDYNQRDMRSLIMGKRGHLKRCQVLHYPNDSKDADATEGRNTENLYAPIYYLEIHVFPCGPRMYTKSIIDQYLSI